MSVLNKPKEDVATVDCKIDDIRHTREYVALKGENVLSFKFDEVGYVRLAKNNEEVAGVKVDKERILRNIGGYEQYKYVRKPIDVKTIDGVLDVYRKINDGRFRVYDKTGNKLLEGEEKEKIGKLMTNFLDSYVFNTPESRDVLDEYIKKEKDKEYKANSVYMNNLRSGR